MRTYLVESYLPETTAGVMAALTERLTAVCSELSRPGCRVGYLHALRVPADELCVYVFTASCADVVAEAARLAGIRHPRISEAVVS